jgi:hypothetical protein
MIASKKELTLTLEQVNGVLELRLPESVFYWGFGNGRAVKAGSKAGTLHKKGYTQIKINGNLFMAHRLIWFVTYGKFPDNQIDHIDGDKSNNRIENLRDVSQKVNSQNQKKLDRPDADLPTGVRVGNRNKFSEIIGYRACWRDMDGKYCDAYFGIKEWHTLEAALAAAVTRRELEIANLMSQGAAYTERHGK